MAKKAKKKLRWIFPLFLFLYAVAFLTATQYGLQWFWDYMDAYEQSRPHIALSTYEEKLTPQYVVGNCDALIDQIDHYVQSEDSCRQVLLDAVTGKLTCAKKTRESTDDKHVYAILCDKKVIGTMEMERCDTPIMGFIPWKVTKDSFDLSYLITDAVSVTVPNTFRVTVNGNLLTADYITEDNIHYPQLEEFYDTYSLPHMVTYQAGPFLGQSKMIIRDPFGKVMKAESLGDFSQYISNCSQTEVEALDTIANDFISSYVAFTTRSGGDNLSNYHKLTEYMVPNGELSKRMYAALDGLGWISDRHATLTELNIHHYVHVGDGRYLCDLTYVVNAKTFSGDVETSSNLKVFFLETDNGLKAESILSY